MQSELFVPEGWVLEIPHQDCEKRMYRDTQGVQYHPHRYCNGKDWVWGWLQVESVAGSPLPVVEPSRS